MIWQVLTRHEPDAVDWHAVDFHSEQEAKDYVWGELNLTGGPVLIALRIKP